MKVKSDSLSARAGNKMTKCQNSDLIWLKYYPEGNIHKNYENAPIENEKNHDIIVVMKKRFILL